MISPHASALDSTARRTSSTDAPSGTSRGPGSAYTLKKYRWIPEGGHGPWYPSVPAVVFPCRAPSLVRSAPFGTDATTGKFQAVQCVHVPRGASWSSTMSASERAPSGMEATSSGGERSDPLHVNSRGMGEPPVNALELTRIVFGTFVLAPRGAQPLVHA